MRVSLLAVGNEVVTGKIIGTNFRDISMRLRALDLEVVEHISVRDCINEIKDAYSYAFKKCDVIICTGGLGPTVDDLTREALAEYFNVDMVINQGIVDDIVLYFKKTDRDMPENNKKQAMFPIDAIVIPNHNGTAPGVIYTKDNKTLVLLPGPPKEMIPMLEESVIPKLKKKGVNKIYKKTYQLMGIGESHAERLIKDLYDKFNNTEIAPYASVGKIDYILQSKNEEELEEASNLFENILNEYIVGSIDKNIEDKVVELLIQNDLTISTAESCTGGMIASKIVNVPNASKVFKESFVTYSNESKTKRLGVREKSLEKYGAVSEVVAKEMAEGVKKVTNSSIGISVTGIAGPTGGTKEKPIGLVYMAISDENDTKVYRNIFSGNRNKVRLRATQLMYYYLYKKLYEK